MDIVVAGNRIASVRSAGTPGLALRPNRAPQTSDRVDATGMYVMPGFVDMHVHAGGAPKNADAEYAYKLWLGHGVTTVRGVPLGGNASPSATRPGATKNEIVAPRIYNYQRPGSGWDKRQRRYALSGARVRAVGRGQRHRRPEARRRSGRIDGRASR